MKVLLVNVNAVAGSTGKIVTDIKNSLEAEGHECIVAYGANETVTTHNYYRICPKVERKINSAISRLTGIYYGVFTPFSFFRLRKLIEKVRPDIVHLHCANGFILDLFKFLEFLSECKIKTVISNHAEFFYTGGCGYAFDCEKWLTGCRKCEDPNYGRIAPIDNAAYVWKRFNTVLSDFDYENLIITSVSPWGTSRSSKSVWMSKFRHRTVLNGLNTQIFHPVEYRGQFPIIPTNKPMVLHVTSSFDLSPASIKGGRFIVELANMLPEVTFVVVASSNSVDKDDLPANLILWGKAKNQQELAELYSLANLTVITSRRETFNMTVAESLSCGTPVAGFKAGGPESIALEAYSDFVEYGDVQALAAVISAKLSTHKDSSAISTQAKSRYSKERMTGDYLSVYNELLS